VNERNRQAGLNFSSKPARWGDGAEGRLEAAGTELSVWPVSPDWLKFKNPEAPAVKREAEEDLGR
jgi:hypothetical protein